MRFGEEGFWFKGKKRNCVSLGADILCILLYLKRNESYQKNIVILYLTIFHEQALILSTVYEMIANEMRSAELAIVVSYPKNASGIIVLLKTMKKY